MDCKAAVKIGDYSRGGKTRGHHQAADHAMGCQEKYTPFGRVNEETGQLHSTFGSSAKTSDFIVDSLHAWWEDQSPEVQTQCTLLPIKADNGPESSGRGTPFLKRMGAFADPIGKPVQLLYYPPYHSKYNPIECCWGVLEQHWNGSLLVDVQTILAGAKSMTWKGIHPVAEWTQTLYEKRGHTLKKSHARGRGSALVLKVVIIDVQTARSMGVLPRVRPGSVG